MKVGGEKIKTVLIEKRIFIFVALLCAALVAAGAYLYIAYNRKEKPDDLTAECTADNSFFYAKLARAFSDNDISTLDEIVPQITNVSASEESVNCLVAITEYNLLISDIPVAEEYYAKITGVADETTKLSNEYARLRLYTVADVNEQLQRAKAVEEEYRVRNNLD